jgi:transposase-like protein
MSERVWSEKDLVRRAKRRLAVLQHAEEISGSVAATCRYYGISRTVFYRWKKRYEDEGLDGLKDRSSAPMHCPNVTSPEVNRQDRAPAPALPLRPVEDLDVPAALPRRADQPVRRVAGPQAPGDEPVAGLAALQTPSRNAGSATRSNDRATICRSTSSS